MKKFVSVLVLGVALAAACGSEVETGGSSSGAGGSGSTSGSGAASSGGGGMPDLSLQGQACPAEGCPAPLECESYCGFAGCGANGSFSSCEIPCKVANGNADCPAGQICVSVADGPGEVCQPS